MCKIFTEDPNIVKRLINIITNYSSISFNSQQQVKAAALRVLTYLCINEQALIKIFKESASGKCFISYISNETSEIIQQEAVGLMVQITSPFIDCNKNIYNELNTLNIIDDFVQNLSQIAKTTSSHEIFLLTSASLANISFKDVESIVKWNTMEILVNACKVRINFDEIIIKDQIVTLLANVARKYPLEIVRSGGLVFLLCSLQLRPSSALENNNNLVAIERIQQKTAVALARLGNHKSVAKLIYKLNGINRLIELCKNAKERNFSDTVLMACIAASRRIAQTFGKLPFKEYDALELIDLPFQEAFSLYTSKNESFV